MSPTTPSSETHRSQTTTVGISSAAVGAVLALVGTWAIGGAASADDLIPVSTTGAVAQQAATSREAATVQGVRYAPGVCIPDDGAPASRSGGRCDGRLGHPGRRGVGCLLWGAGLGWGGGSGS